MKEKIFYIDDNLFAKQDDKIIEIEKTDIKGRYRATGTFKNDSRKKSYNGLYSKDYLIKVIEDERQETIHIRTAQRLLQNIKEKAIITNRVKLYDMIGIDLAVATYTRQQDKVKNIIGENRKRYTQKKAELKADNAVIKEMLHKILNNQGWEFDEETYVSDYLSNKVSNTDNYFKQKKKD